MVNITKYFMCTKCYRIHTVNINYDIKDISTNSDMNWQLDLRQRGTMCNNKCNGALVEIDRDMIYAIQTLNIKGYHTQFCCQGHGMYDKANIVFEPYLYTIVEHISPPESWKYVLMTKDPAIRSIKVALEHRIDNCENEYIHNLNEWADSLINIMKGSS